MVFKYIFYKIKKKEIEFDKFIIKLKNVNERECHYIIISYTEWLRIYSTFFTFS